jgi:hypothetical protein
VQLKGRSDAVLRYRRGYDLGEREAPKKPTDPLFALSSGALPATTLPLRLHAAALPTGGRDARVALSLEVTVPRALMRDADERLQDQIRYAVVAIDTRGAKVKDAVGRGARMVLRPRDPTLPPPESVTYQISESMELAPGSYQLRASATSTRLGDGGSVYLALDVPDFRSARLAISDLVLGYAGGPRVASLAPPPLAGRGRAGGGAARGRGVPPPPRSSPTPDGLPFAPTLDREFTTADDLALFFHVVRRDRARGVDVAIAIVDVNDRVLRRYTQKLPPEHAGRVTFGLPLSAAGAGVFRIRVEASDGVNDAASEVGIVVAAR